MKKNRIAALCGILLLLALLPIPMRLKDGGSVVYSALLYKVTDVHALASMEDAENGKDYYEGVIVELLGVEVFNNVQ